MASLSVIGQLHLWAGVAAFIAGFIAMVLPKGSTLHKKAGVTFVLTMVLLCLSSMHFTFARDLQFTLFLALFSLYLLLTGWYSVARKAMTATRYDRWGFYGVLGITLSSLLIALLGEGLGWQHPDSEPPYAGYLVFTLFGALLAFGDYRLLQQTSISNQARLIRHLWRLCFALFIATVIFFGGNSEILPKVLQTEITALVPITTLIGFTLYWVVKLRWFERCEDGKRARQRAR